MERIDEHEIARAFWNRVDQMRGKIQLGELALMCDMSFTTLRNQKSGRRQQLPKTLQAFSIAKALKTTVEFLLTGEEHHSFNSTLYTAYLNASDANRKIVDLALALNEAQNQREMVNA